MRRQQFEDTGVVAIPRLWSAQECDAGIAQLAALDSDCAGTRCLLAEDWCKTMARHLREHAGIAEIVPADFVALQCTYFEKSVDRNWLVPIHQARRLLGA